jgi:hypothetical protein
LGKSKGTKSSKGSAATAINKATNRLIVGRRIKAESVTSEVTSFQQYVSIGYRRDPTNRMQLTLIIPTQILLDTQLIAAHELGNRGIHSRF